MTSVPEADESYEPGSTSSPWEDTEDDDDGDSVLNGKVLVDEKYIMSLFNFCQFCGAPVTGTEKHYVGAQLNVKWRCAKSHKGKWVSSPNVRGMPEVHLQAAAAIVFTGSTFADLSGWQKAMKLHMFGDTTFYAIQKAYLHPAIHRLYEDQINGILARLLFEQEEAGKRPQLLGDGRCDSPGYNAKYCHYTFMLADTKEIIHTELVQVI